MLLTLEELAVMLSLEKDVGLHTKDVAYYAVKQFPNEQSRVDVKTALATIDRLVGINLISRDRSRFLYPTPDGTESVRHTKEVLNGLVSKLKFY
jgi:hypothetical protein